MCTNLFDPFDNLVNRLYHSIEEETETEVGGEWCGSDPQEKRLKNRKEFVGSLESAQLRPHDEDGVL